MKTRLHLRVLRNKIHEYDGMENQCLNQRPLSNVRFESLTDMGQDDTMSALPPARSPDTRLSGRANSNSQVFVFVNLVAHAPDRNSENIGGPCSAPTTMDECMEDELAFDLVDRVADKVRNDLIYSQPTKVHRILRCRVIGCSCNR